MRRVIPFLLVLIGILTSLYAQDKIKSQGEAVAITPDDEYFIRPSWSPAGDKIAFTSRKQKGIWVCNLTTGTLVQLVDKEGAGYKFSWSPDGEYIAYRASYRDNQRISMAIEIVELTTGKISELSAKQKNLSVPQWGKNNSTLFFTAQSQLKNIETGITLTKAKSHQDYFVYTNYGKLQIAETLQPDKVEWVDFEKQIINPSLSPDNIYIACEEVGGELLILDRSNGDRTELGAGHRPSWSPDGKWICYMVTEDNGHRYLASDIFVASLDGQTRINLTDSKDKLEMNPSWSPKGKAIAYNEQSSGVIYVQGIQIGQ